MKIEYKFCDGLIELMKKTPLDQINVVMLSDHIGSNRQTFYYHFRDIGDVIDSILYQDKKIYLTKIFDFEQIQGLKIKIFLLILYIGKDKCFFFITSFLIKLDNIFLYVSCVLDVS